MRLAVLLFFAGASLRFDVMDARGKKPAGVTIEAGAPAADGWCSLTVTAKKGEFVLVWPFDGRAKVPDGPEGVPVIVVEKGDARAERNPRVVAALLAASLLGVRHDVGIEVRNVGLSDSDDPFIRGVGLLNAGKPVDAVNFLGLALKERERQLTRFPSEIYPAAMLYGKALFAAGKFDDAALAFLKAVKQRPSDRAARMARNQALTKAGKPDAVEEIP